MPIDIATGNVHLEYEDAVALGQVELVWDRLYSNVFLDRPAGSLGAGWWSRYFATLTRHPAGFEFVGPTGDADFVGDTDGEVQRGGVVRHLGAYFEVFAAAGRYVVQQWDVETGNVTRYCFWPGTEGEPWPLASIEDVTGQAVDLIRDGAGRLVAVRARADGRTLRLGCRADGRITHVSLMGADGMHHEVARYEYDVLGKLTVAADGRGLADRFEYDDAGRLARMLPKDGGVTSYRYDRQGRCIRASGLNRYDEKRLRFLDAIRATEVTDSYGAMAYYEFLPSGQVLLERDPAGGVMRSEYDEHGRVIGMTDPTGAVTRYSYDGSGNCCEIVNALGETRQFRFNQHHQPVAMRDPARNVWRREYDEHNRLVATTEPLGGRWTLAYGADGNLAVLTNPSGHSRRFHYALGALLQSTDWSGNVTTLQYDAFGRLTESTDPLGHTVRQRYDPVGNLVEVQLPHGGSVRFEYDAGGGCSRVVDAAGRVVQRRFGPCRRLLESIDPNGYSLRYFWGTEPGRLERVENERGECYHLVHDAAGRCIKEIGFDGREMEFVYDGAARCVATRNGLGETVVVERDALGRLTALRAPDGSGNAFTYDVLGNVVEATTPESSVRLERDAMGRLLRETQTSAAGEHWVGYSLDAMGNVVAMETDLGLRVDYELDAEGAWTALRTHLGHAFRFAHDARGCEVQRRLPGGLVLDQQHDPVGGMLEQRLGRSPACPAPPTEVRRSGDVLVRRSYTRDLSGLVCSIDDQTAGKIDYAFDAGERLLQVLRAGVPSESFDYDAAGNLTRARSTGAVAPVDEPFVYDHGSRLAGRGTMRYEYDAHGRLVRMVDAADPAAERTWVYEWDGVDRLRSVSRSDGKTWRYTYDAFSRRVAKTGPDGDVHFVWSAHVPVHELSGRTGAWTGYLFEQDSFVPLAQLRGAEMFSVIPDHLGTPQEMIDGTGRVVWRLRQSAYGVDESPSNGAGGQPRCPFRFQGQYYDEETGLHYNRYRYYDPRTARFIQQDPLHLGASSNFYAYARNPVRWIDPVGLCLSQFLKNKLKRIRNQTAAGGNRGVTGSVTTAEARQLGEAFVGPGFRETSTTGGVPILISADGQRQFRGSSEKSGVNPMTMQPYSQTGTQANFQSREGDAGPWTNNVHLDVE
jgi:RHS repeat-associated protein